MGIELYEQERMKNLLCKPVIGTFSYNEMAEPKELDNNIMQLKAKMFEKNEEESDRIMVSQMEFADQAEFLSLRTKLIELV